MRVELDLDERGVEGERLDELTTAARWELRDLSVGRVDRPLAGDAPDGARGDAVAIAALVITLADSKALATVVHFARSWTGVGRPRTVRLAVDGDELVITGAMKEDTHDIDAWVKRRLERGADG